MSIVLVPSGVAITMRMPFIRRPMLIETI